MAEVLSLVLHQDERGCALCGGAGPRGRVPTKTHVLNLLHRLIDERPADPPEVAPPSGLALSEEPRANVNRYDGLRGQTAGGAPCAMTLPAELS